MAVIDFNDSNTGGYGYGQAILTSQVTVSASNIAGNYTLFNLIDGDKTTNINGTTYSSIMSSGSPTGSLNFNSPWTGMTSWTDTAGTGNGYALIAGTGVFVSQMEVPLTTPYSFTNKWFEFGMKH